MKKNRFPFLVVSSVASVAIATAVVLTAGGKGPFNRTLGSEETVIWNHYDAVAPTFANAGIKEYWVSCTSHEHQFVAPTGDSIEIVSKGAPSQEFIDALDANDDRLMPKIPSLISFENDFEAEHVLTEARNTYEISTEHVRSGSKALKITNAAANHQSLTVSKAYYDALPDAGISFWLYSDAAFNGNLDSGTTIYNTGKDNGAAINYWNPLSEWKQYVIAKSSIALQSSGQYSVFCITASSSVVFYVDDVKPYSGSMSKSVIDFEDQYDLNSANSQVNPYEISTEQAHSGISSFKVQTTSEYSQVLNLSDDFYNSLPDAGITFWMYASGAFNGNVAHQGSASSANVCHYYAPFNEWKQYTVSKDQLDETAGRHYVFLPYSFGDSLTVYIDDLHPTDFVETDNVSGDSRNPTSISDERVYEGAYSLKTTITVANSGAFLIKDSYYNALPDEGLTFFLNCDRAFNASSVKYRNLGQWQQFTIAKADIKYTANYGGTTYYYVCLPSEAFDQPIYIDGIAPASPV